MFSLDIVLHHSGHSKISFFFSLLMICTLYVALNSALGVQQKSLLAICSTYFGLSRSFFPFGVLCIFALNYTVWVWHELTLVNIFILQKNTAKNVEVQGFNPGLIVLIVVGGLLLAFLVGNYLLYMYAQKTLPPKKKKPVSKKKLKRERLKQGVSAPGE